MASLTPNLGNRRGNYSPLMGKRREAWESWARIARSQAGQDFRPQQSRQHCLPTQVQSPAFTDPVTHLKTVFRLLASGLLQWYYNNSDTN